MICNWILFISYVRITFKYTGCAIFFYLEKYNESNCTKKIKKFKLTRDPCKIGLLRATFYIQFIVHFEPFNLMYR
jgi:hypothetical protein